MEPEKQTSEETVRDIDAIMSLSETSGNASFDAVQRQELDFLNSVYGKDLKILISTFPYKFQVTINPYPDHGNLIFPNYCPDFETIVLFELSETYPFNYPQVRPFGAPKEISKAPIFVELQEKFKPTVPNPTKAPICFAICENIRGFLMAKLKKEFPDAKRIRHYLDKEISEEEVIEKKEWAAFENLTKKATHTPLTRENFTQWLKDFSAEQKLNEKKKKMNEKPTGKQIFMMSSNGLFLDEGETGADDEDADLAKREQTESEEEELEFDEDLFNDEEDFDFEPEAELEEAEAD